MALTWVESDLVNGDFTDELLGWSEVYRTEILNTGTKLPNVLDPQDMTAHDGGTAFFSVTATANPRFSLTGTYSPNGSGLASQEITIPAGAKLARLKGEAGESGEVSAIDTTRAGGSLELYNSAGDLIGGCCSFNAHSKKQAPHVFSVIAIVPSDTATAVVKACLGERHNNNAVYVDNLSVQWATGVDADISVGSNVINNGGFETGDTAQWSQVGVDPIRIDVASQVYDSAIKGAYCITFPATGQQGVIRQTKTVTSGATHVVFSALISSTDRESDAELDVKFFDSDGHTLTTHRVTGSSGFAYGTHYSSYASLAIRVPDGAASLTADVRMRAHLDGYYGTGVSYCDDVSLKFVTIPDEISETAITDPLNYQWHDELTGLIDGETSSILSFPAGVGDNGRRFFCDVHDPSVGTTRSYAALLTVLAPAVTPPPVIPPPIIPPEPLPLPDECAISMPCCLPAPLVAGHGYESSSRVRRNDLASGPPIYTLEDDDGYELFSVSWSFNNVETQIFRNFYRHTIASGSKEFCIDLMVDGWNGVKRTKTHRVYFEGQPQYALHGLRWNVSATLLAIQEQINDECDGLLLAEAYCVFTSGLEWAMADLHDIVENVLWEYP